MKKILFFIILFFCFIFNVKAETAILTKDVYDNTYVYYYDSNMGTTRYLHASKYLFGTTPAYCIELGKDISSYNYTYTNSFDGINIDEEKLNFIKLYSYYGYNYPGHDTDRYYMATQDLIWRTLVGTSIKFTIGFNPDKFYNLSKEMEEISALVYKHNIKPSFDGDTLTVVKGKGGTFVDSNGVLSLYYSDNNYVEIIGNKLVIEPGFDDDTIVLKRLNYTDKEFFLYSSGSSQKMITSGSISNSNSEVKINYISGSIEIIKQDKDTQSLTATGDGTLDGAIYDLLDQDRNIVGTFVTGKKNKIDGLGLGRYYIKERKASTGYELDGKLYVIDITEDNLDVVKTVYEKAIKRKVDLFKVYASDETGFLVGEANIQFDIFDKNNKLVTSIITDSEGYASTVLPFGLYTIKQVNSTDNYYKIDDFVINIDSSDDRPIFKLISNSEIKAKVRVVKKDADTLENITNGKAMFKIFDVENNKYVSFKVSYPNEEEIDTFSINNDGTFTTPEELKPGKYILYEVDTDMNGYLYNKSGVPFVIGDSMSSIKDGDDVILEIVFYNKRVKGILNIFKYGEFINYKNDNYFYKKDFLNDVVFYLYAEEDIYENNKLIYNKDGLVGECTTSDGRCSISNLPLGNYYLKEIFSSMGNVVSSSVYKINFSYKDQYTKEIVYNLEVDNYLPKGKVIINKYETGTKRGIGNTLIEIRNIDNEIVYKGYTDSNGQIKLDDMLYGKYYVSEIEASSGYRLTSDKIYFEVGDEDVVIDIYNERISVPNTGIGINARDIVVFSNLILAVVVLIIFRKKRYIIVGTLFIIIVCLSYFGIRIYSYYNDIKNNDKATHAVLENRINSINNDKYRYKAILEIPSVNIKRGILDIDSRYNKAKYNIELVKESDDMIVLAAHNGNNYNSYFGNLKNISLGDDINYYFGGKLYKYIYTDRYEIKKNGYADIYRNKDKKAIVLVTCKDNSDDGQVIFIGYLSSVSDY